MQFSRSYPLERNRYPFICITWLLGYSNLTVYYDDDEIGRINGDFRALLHPQAFQLPDGSLLIIKLGIGFWGPQLRVTRNGEPLPESSQDAGGTVRNAKFLLQGMGILNIGIGLLYLVASNMQTEQIVSAVFFIILGFLVYWLAENVGTRSIIAWVIVAIIFAIDLFEKTMFVYFIFFRPGKDIPPVFSLTSLLVIVVFLSRLAIVIYLEKTRQAIFRLKREER